MRVIHRSVGSLLMAVCCVQPLMVKAQEVPSWQYLPEVDVYVRTGYETRLFFFSALTRERPRNLVDGFVAGQFEVGLPPVLRELFTEYDNEELPFEYLRFKFGVLHMSYLDGPDVTHEIRGMIELNPRETFGNGYVVLLRNRVELRWLGGEYSTRLRSRLWIEKMFFKDSDVPITPYLNTEPFYDFRYNGFSRLLSQAGIAFAVTPWLSPEVLVGIQRDWLPDDVTTYMFGLTATMYFSSCGRDRPDQPIDIYLLRSSLLRTSLLRSSMLRSSSLQ